MFSHSSNSETIHCLLQTVITTKVLNLLLLFLVIIVLLVTQFHIADCY